jgi:hypothetical protein
MKSNFNLKTLDKVKMRLNLDLPKPLLRAMQVHSKRLSGCKRQKKGSKAHFARQAILIVLRDYFDVNFEKINPEVYKISKISVDIT